ncbi:MAG: YitT family protein [Sphaerochaetaceae bacterium]
MIKTHKLRDYTFIVLGSLITAVGIAAFITPAKLAGGGVSGIAVIFYHLFNFEVGTSIFLLSLPLFLAGLKIFGKRYGVTSLMGTLLLSLFTSLFGLLWGFEGFLSYDNPVDVLLSALFGGFLAGFGMGVVLKGGANTGGTDIAAQILSKYTPISVGSSLFLVDGLVILAGGFAFGLKSALFATITLVATSAAINFVLLKMGTRYAKTALIVSEAHGEISRRISEELGHGGTLLSGYGIYSKEERSVLMTVIPNQKITQLNTIVKETDPQAFMIIEEAYEVIGEGFSPMEKR